MVADNLTNEQKTELARRLVKVFDGAFSNEYSDPDPEAVYKIFSDKKIIGSAIIIGNDGSLTINPPAIERITSKKDAKLIDQLCTELSHLERVNLGGGQEISADFIEQTIGKHEYKLCPEAAVAFLCVLDTYRDKDAVQKDLRLIDQYYKGEAAIAVRDFIDTSKAVAKEFIDDSAASLKRLPQDAKDTQAKAKALAEKARAQHPQPATQAHWIPGVGTSSLDALAQDIRGLNLPGYRPFGSKSHQEALNDILKPDLFPNGVPLNKLMPELGTPLKQMMLSDNERLTLVAVAQFLDPASSTLKQDVLNHLQHLQEDRKAIADGTVVITADTIRYFLERTLDHKLEDYNRDAVADLQNAIRSAQNGLSTRLGNAKQGVLDYLKDAIASAQQDVRDDKAALDARLNTIRGSAVSRITETAHQTLNQIVQDGQKAGQTVLDKASQVKDSLGKLGKEVNDLKTAAKADDGYNSGKYRTAVEGKLGVADRQPTVPLSDRIKPKKWLDALFSKASAKENAPDSAGPSR